MARTLRLLVFSPYYPPHRGGLMSHAAEFNHYMLARGYTTTVVTPRLRPDAAPYEEPEPGVIVWRFPAWEVVANYPLPKFWSASFWRMWGQLQSHQHDIVITRTRFFFTSCMGWWFSTRKAIPWLHIEHGSGYVRSGNSLVQAVAHMYDTTVGAMVLDHAGAVVANSHASGQFIIKLSKRKDVRVIYRGVEENMYRSIQAKVLKRHPQKLVVVFVGRLINGKGVQDLLQALARVRADIPVRSLIIGGGPARESLKRLARRLRIVDLVDFTDELPVENAVALLKASDVFVNPSYTEGIPTAVIEAALCRVPIIASNVGGTSEIIRDQVSGLLFEAGDIQSLTKSLARLLSSETERKRLAENAYREIQGRFSWEHSAREYDAVLRNLVPETR